METQRYDSTVPFSALCELFERCKNSNVAKKVKYMKIFLNNYKDHDFFPVLRLILPHVDNLREAYGMKEYTIAKYYIEILGISPRSGDAIRMTEWKKPIVFPEEKLGFFDIKTSVSPEEKTLDIFQRKNPAFFPLEKKTIGFSSQSRNVDGGDFGNAVYMSLRNRSPERGTLSIYDINLCLDKLSGNKEEKIRILRYIIKNTTSLQQKWLIRIILKELKLGVSEKNVLKILHPDAIDLLNLTSDLRYMCDGIKAYRCEGKELYDMKTIRLFHPIKPMLSGRRSDTFIADPLKQLVIETKYDGERVQIHVGKNGTRLFSRNSKDITNIYGRKLIPIINSTLDKDVKECIIDGELIVWDTETESFEQFGKLKNLMTTDNEKKQLCYIAFDILYINEKSTLDLSLRKRREILERCIPLPKYRQFEIVEQKHVVSNDDISQALDLAIENREEGIIIKDLNSRYTPNERKDKWIKIKPEYIEGKGDDIDAIILGGFYGKGRRAGCFSHFLVGIKDEEGKFYSLARVGSGYSDSELKNIQIMLKNNWITKRPNYVNIGTSADKPDVWIEPRNSIILQIKTSQITETDKYACGYTLRFPRVVKIRNDKDYRDCMNVDELPDFIRLFNKKENKNDEISPEKNIRALDVKPKSRKKEYFVMKHNKAPVNLPVKIDNIFEGKQFCVLNGSPEENTKEQIEKEIYRLGGTLVQNPLKETSYILAYKDTIKVKNLIQLSITVIHIDWLLECIKLKEIIPIEERYVFKKKSV